MDLLANIWTYFMSHSCRVRQCGYRPSGAGWHFLGGGDVGEFAAGGVDFALAICNTHPDEFDQWNARCAEPGNFVSWLCRILV